MLQACIKCGQITESRIRFVHQGESFTAPLCEAHGEAYDRRKVCGQSVAGFLATFGEPSASSPAGGGVSCE